MGRKGKRTIKGGGQPETKLCIVGGQLQGIEAAYLARKAKFKTILIDKRLNPPAKNLAHEFYMADVVKNPITVKKILKDVDALLPATEKRDALISLRNLCRECQIPYLQDNDAFWITSDKQKTKEFFAQKNIPQPKPWPECKFPIIVKPVQGSGSENVSRINNPARLNKLLKEKEVNLEEFVIQEFIEGAALSLEALGVDGNPTTLQITQLEFDSQYGCKRVFTPVETSEKVNSKLTETTENIVRELKLTGLTDVQAIVDKDSTVKINEINARLPSQTPTAVFHSSGVNIVELLRKIYMENELPCIHLKNFNAVIYQHLKVSDKTLMTVGEHALTEAEDLNLKTKFMGADEAITNIGENDDINSYIATLIVKDNTLDKAHHRMNQVIFNLMKNLKLEDFIDPSPNRPDHKRARYQS